jgi:hypothetical protein
MDKRVGVAVSAAGSSIAATTDRPVSVGVVVVAPMAQPPNAISRTVAVATPARVKGRLWVIAVVPVEIASHHQIRTLNTTRGDGSSVYSIARLGWRDNRQLR